MALIKAYVPGTYSGSMNVGTPAIVPLEVDTPSMNCMDIINVMPVIGNSYAVDCDFLALSDSGSVFFMDTDTQQLTHAIPLTSAVSSGVDFTENDILMIYSIETGFIVVAILFFGMMRQFKKIAPLLF